MCGIVGIFNYNCSRAIERDTLLSMCGAIAHRGPDDEGVYFDLDNKLALGHRRLSIIDLKTGHQPMSSSDGMIWIVFNGEIYNFYELKKDLINKGYKFITNSDTEVIIYIYAEYGERGFSLLNGIFALGIFDRKKRCLILARDHFGIKPLYYALTDGSLVFSSEIKAMLRSYAVKKDLDYEALNTFLTFRYNPSPQTLFKDIRKLYPGYYLKIRVGQEAEYDSYSNYLPATVKHVPEEEAIEEYQRLLSQAVRRQMIADVPVGALLSGGIDSASIAYLMQSNSDKPIKTFSIGFPGRGEFNELLQARHSSEVIGTEHYEIQLTRQEYMDSFFNSLYHVEEPIAEPTISALYHLAKLASGHLKVVLTGQGADEVLAGYNSYIAEKYINKYSILLRHMPLKSISRLLLRNDRFKKIASIVKISSDVQRFAGIYTIFTPGQKELLFNEDTKAKVRNNDLMLLERLYSQSKGLSDSVSRLMFIDARMSLSDNLLLFNDKVAMANSLEMRVPFLDIELVKFLESLPSSLKLRFYARKYIHRKASRKWLPGEITRRKKRSFETPMDQWFRSEISFLAKRIINDKNSACRKYFALPYVNKIIDDHYQGRENFNTHIFALLSFEIWHKTFLEDGLCIKM